VITHRHLARIEVDPALLAVALTTDGELHCTVGAPADATLVRVYHDYQRDMVVLVFEHASFHAVPSGAEIPELAAEIEASRSFWVPPVTEGPTDHERE
jgi:hypothetical protein